MPFYSVRWIRNKNKSQLHFDLVLLYCRRVHQRGSRLALWAQPATEDYITAGSSKKLNSHGGVYTRNAYLAKHSFQMCAKQLHAQHKLATERGPVSQFSTRHSCQWGPNLWQYASHPFLRSDNSVLLFTPTWITQTESITHGIISLLQNEKCRSQTFCLLSLGCDLLTWRPSYLFPAVFSQVFWTFLFLSTTSNYELTLINLSLL